MSNKLNVYTEGAVCVHLIKLLPPFPRPSENVSITLNLNTRRDANAKYTTFV